MVFLTPNDQRTVSICQSERRECIAHVRNSFQRTNVRVRTLSWYVATHSKLHLV